MVASTKFDRRRFIGQTLAVSSAASLQARSKTGAPKGKLFAGASMANITPPLGCAIAGNMTYTPAVEIHDELHVRSLVLDNGQARLAFAVVDSCMVPGDVIQRAKQLIHQQTDIPPVNILVSATHTHSAPPATHLFQSMPDKAYVDWLVVRIADGVRLAVNRLQPARIGWGVGREESLLFTRRHFLKPGTMPPNPFDRTDELVKMNPGVGNPNIIRAESAVDPDLGVLVVESASGQPICVLGNYALHYVGGVGSGHISADYFGVWANSMARLAGAQGSPAFVPILTNACSGSTTSTDVHGPRVQHPPYVKMQWVADIVAAEAYRTWRRVDFQDWVELGARQEELELGVRLPSSADVTSARNILAASSSTGQYKELRQIYARETVILSETYSKTVKTPVQAVRIGSLGIATFPGEAFAELGLEVKAASPFKPTMLIELANDYRGYIPTVEAHEHGGYETWRAKSSYLEKGAAPKMVAAALRGLAALAG
jgi:neutral ceramidase